MPEFIENKHCIVNFDGNSGIRASFRKCNLSRATQVVGDNDWQTEKWPGVAVIRGQRTNSSQWHRYSRIGLKLVSLKSFVAFFDKRTFIISIFSRPRNRMLSSSEWVCGQPSETWSASLCYGLHLKTLATTSRALRSILTAGCRITYQTEVQRCASCVITIGGC